jgi:hypothetical protein
MTIPRFTAENSLYQSSSSNYRMRSTGMVNIHTIVTPQLRNLYCNLNGDGFTCYESGGFYDGPSDGPERDLVAIACRRRCQRLTGSKRAECLSDC